MTHIISFFTWKRMRVKAAGSITRRPMDLASGIIHKIRGMEIHQKSPTIIKRYKVKRATLPTLPVAVKRRTTM